MRTTGTLLIDPDRSHLAKGVEKGGAKAHTKTNLLRQRKEIPKSAYMENHELHNPPPPVSLPPAPSPTWFNQAQPAINFTQLQPEDRCHCVLRLVGPLHGLRAPLHDRLLELASLEEPVPVARSD
ncbi:hypothetical protein PtA15_15A138 [Puccinia triticina]|uniref:Uncharacterized protein n=1 Tax=Puccinia triticina TaxID=208348 RepID=A0ABY7D4Z2_9BASI|nr:uncharacterized protein PtA15_15A138 [Puccinia triticina]WAQ91747.1 hypothetical protein PtA15_15A138 [Puccinia triticina]